MKQLVLTSLLGLCFLIPHAKENDSYKASLATIGQAKKSALSPQEGGTYSISAEDGKVVLTAGIVQRILHVSEDGVFTTHLTVENKSLISQNTEEVSFRISRADPNREPGTTWSSVFNHLKIHIYQPAPRVTRRTKIGITRYGAGNT